MLSISIFDLGSSSTENPYSTGSVPWQWCWALAIQRITAAPRVPIKRNHPTGPRANPRKRYRRLHPTTHRGRVEVQTHHLSNRSQSCRWNMAVAQGPEGEEESPEGLSILPAKPPILTTCRDTGTTNQNRPGAIGDVAMPGSWRLCSDCPRTLQGVLYGSGHGGGEVAGVENYTARARAPLPTPPSRTAEHRPKCTCVKTVHALCAARRIGDDAVPPMYREPQCPPSPSEAS